MPPIDLKFINRLRVLWNNIVTNFERKKSIYPSMRLHMEHYLKRENIKLENNTYFQYASLDVTMASRQAFNVYGVVCTYADIQELLDGSGKTLPYLKATVVRIFYLLLKDKLKNETMSYFLQNSMDIDSSLKKLFNNSNDGIFLFDYFIYSGVHSDMWCTVVVEKKGPFEYDLITFLPSEDCRETNTVISDFVAKAMEVQYKFLKENNNAESPWNWQALVLNRKIINDHTPLHNFKIADAGIYTIFKTYLYMCYKEDMTVVSDDLHKFRKLVLYMMVTMDINYGQMKAGDDPAPEDANIRY